MSEVKREPPRPAPGRVCADCKSTKHTEVYCPGLGRIRCGVCGKRQRDHDMTGKPCIAGIREGLVIG